MPAPIPSAGFAKQPEYRRRSRWSRLRHRPWLVAGVLAALLVGAAAATYGYLRLTHQLPGQRLAQRSAAAMEKLIGTPEFEQFVVVPLRQYLTVGLTVGARPDDLADMIRRSTQYEIATPPKYQRPPSDPSPLIGGWRDIIDALNARGVPVYGYPGQLQERERWLRVYVATRVLTIDQLVREANTEQLARARGPVVVAAGVEPISAAEYARQLQESTARIARLRDEIFPGTDASLFLRTAGSIDVAERAIVRRFGVTAQELQAILFLAQNAERVQQTKRR